MIENEKQLQITLDAIAGFEETLRYLDDIYPTAPRKDLLKLRRAAIVSELDVLRLQVQVYRGRPRVP